MHANPNVISRESGGAGVPFNQVLTIHIESESKNTLFLLFEFVSGLLL